MDEIEFDPVEADWFYRWAPAFGGMGRLLTLVVCRYLAAGDELNAETIKHLNESLDQREGANTEAIVDQMD